MDCQMRELRRWRYRLLALALVAVFAACSRADPAGPSGMPSSSTVATASNPFPPLPSPTTTVNDRSRLPATTTGEARSIVVPRAAAPSIDGMLAAGEWDGAAQSPMSDGASILLMHRDATLYLAVAGDEIGSINVLIASEEEVRILHSSAALGSALYEKGSGRWELVHGFSWCCRSRDDDQGRRALLDEEGWQANIGFTGDPGTVEYQIAVPWQGAALAVSSVRDQEDMGFWPADLPEAARLELVGVPPQERTYDTGLWPILTPAA